MQDPTKLDHIQTNRPVTEVAVGIILSPAGDYLLAKRPTGKPFAGYWEFPGGKLEEGEGVFDALARELKEELGIEVHSSTAWNTIEHDYPHAYVRLHLHLVSDWSGSAQGLEGQELHWQRFSTESELDPLLPATITIIEMMKSSPASF